jgi:putative redox protein
MSTVRAKLTYTNGLQFVGQADSGHAIVLDSDSGVGGQNSGLRPMELLAIGLGGCSGMDVASILKKKKEKLSGLEINVEAKKAEDHPQKYTDMRIEFIVKGKNLSEEAVKKAIQLSMDKYCSVKATLEGTAAISFNYKIIEE